MLDAQVLQVGLMCWRDVYMLVPSSLEKCWLHRYLVCGSVGLKCWRESV